MDTAVHKDSGIVGLINTHYYFLTLINVYLLTV